MTNETHTVEYTGSAKEVRHTATGLSASGDDPRISGLSGDEADDLVATGLFERVSPDEPAGPDDENPTAEG